MPDLPETSPLDASFEIRRMSRADVDLALDWAALEGWNPGLDDANSFYCADPQGFFIGTWKGEPVGVVSAVAYGDALGFIGLYIVRPGWRGKGFGMPLWQAGMAYLGARNVALDGVLAQQANYRKSGFVLAYRNVRYEGVARVPDASQDMNIVDARNVPFDRMLAFDTQHFCAPRAAFLRAWLDAPHARSVAALDGDTLRGVAVMRRCRVGHKIGPLFAENLQVARALFRSLAADVAGERVVIDVPESNASAIALALEHEMTNIFETARMYTRTPPDMPLDRVFGVTTFELG